MMRSISLPLVLIIVGASIFAVTDSGSEAREKAASKISREVLERRREAARKIFRLNLERCKAGEALLDESLSMWSERLLAAELAMIDNPADRIAALKAHVERQREVARIATTIAESGQGRDDVAKYFLIDAEIQLQEATSE